MPADADGARAADDGDVDGAMVSDHWQPTPLLPRRLGDHCRSPADGPIRVDDPLATKAGRVFLELLNDLNGGQAASHLCPHG